MTEIARNSESPMHSRIIFLEKNIADLEKEICEAENAVNIFSARIRAALLPQILRIRELSAIYKKLQTEKKRKRLEQKKKGKNYREPTGLKQVNRQTGLKAGLEPVAQEELKRLYKEAIRQVHPDKFAQDIPGKTERATEITMQLIDYYENGNLEELKGFYEYIISGNAMSHVPCQPESIADPQAFLTFLLKKQQELAISLADLKNSELYQVLQTYPDPLTFIPELGLQFENKIQQLQKRTRKAKT